MGDAEVSIDVDTNHKKLSSRVFGRRVLQILNSGGLGGIRTRDQKIKSLLLYQLSYQSKIGIPKI
jgi:hypothetical protein